MNVVFFAMIVFFGIELMHKSDDWQRLLSSLIWV